MGTVSLPAYVASGVGAPGVQPQLLETAQQTVLMMLRTGLNQELLRVYSAFNPAPVSLDGINLTTVDDNHFYTSEVIDPLVAPAVFVLHEGADEDLLAGQNFELSTHRIFVVMLIEDVEITRLNSAVQRYAIAGWRVLHDRNFNNLRCYVRGFNISAAYSRKQDPGVRNFRKDVTMRCEARLYEPI